MSKKWKKRVRRIDHVAAKVGAVAVNVIPGVGQVASVAISAGIAADEMAAAQRHAKDTKERNARTKAAAETAFNANFEIIKRPTMAPNPGAPANGGPVGNTATPMTRPNVPAQEKVWLFAAGALLLLAVAMKR